MFRNMATYYKLPQTCTVVLHLNRDQVPALRARYPNMHIVMRAYTPNWTQEPPNTWAARIAEWMTELRHFAVVDVTAANEQNLAVEGHPFAAPFNGSEIPSGKVYEDIRDWNMEVTRELRRLIPWATIHFPALSQGHSDDQDDGRGYVGFEILRPAVEACDVLDVHTYWNGAANRTDIFYGQRYKKVRALFPNTRMFVSECGSDVNQRSDNGADYVAWLNELPNYVEGAAFFIWDTTKEENGAEQIWCIWNKPSIISALTAYTPITPPPSPPSPPVPSPDVGWCPFAVRRPVKNFSAGRQGQTIRAVVLHVADGPLAALFPTFNATQMVSAHFGIGKLGEIEQYVSILDTAWGNGLTYAGGKWMNSRGKFVVPAWNGIIAGINPNLQTVSVEHEGTPKDTWTPLMATANAKLVAWIFEQAKLKQVPYDTLVLHSQLDPVDRKSCPGYLIEQGVMKMPLTEKPDAHAPWITIERYAGAEPYWKLTEFQYLPAGQSDGTCNFYVVGWKDQQPAIGAVVRLLWPDGTAVKVLERKEIPPDNRIQAGTDFYLNAMFDPNKVEEGPYRIQMTGNSDIVRGMGLPMNRHDGWFGAWEWIATLPAATLVDAVWARARSVPWMPVNHDAMLWKKAQRLKTEDQQTDELAFVYEGEDYLVQVFNLGILYAKKSEAGDPDKIQIVRK